MRIKIGQQKRVHMTVEAAQIVAFALAGKIFRMHFYLASVFYIVTVKIPDISQPYRSVHGRHFILFVGGMAAYLPCKENFALAKVGNVGNWPSVPVTLKYFAR